VRELEKEAMQENVLRFEPKEALYVSNENPLLFYRTIAQLAQTHLLPDGRLYFEINEYLSEEMHEMLRQEGFTSVVLKNDLYGRPRMMKAQR
jgi:release factor glutamine methyltransferase